MKNLGRYWLAMSFVAAAFATSALLYGRLPAIMPTHWNDQGMIDGWMPKSRGAVVIPGTALVIVVFLVLLAPSSEEESAPTWKSRHFPTIVAAAAGFMLCVNALVLMAGLGWHLDMPSHLSIGAGLLITVLANNLGKVPRNGLVGIRTPWTLADKEVWGRTHRIAGWLFLLAGAAMAVTGFMGLGVTPGLIAIGAATLLSAGYSYVLWRRLRRNP